MSNQLSFARGQSYLGTNANQPPNWSFNDRDPDQYDTQNVSIGDLWLNTVAERVWCLVSLEGNITSKGALATWIQFGGGAGNGILTIEGNDGVKVPGDITANINLIGTDPFTFTGNIGSNTVTLSSNGTIATEYTTEDGSIAMPTGGNLNIVGGPNIGTTASTPDTVDIFLTGFTPSAVVIGDGTGGLTSLGTMTDGQLVIGRTGDDPLVGNLTAGAGVTITNGPGTITIAASGGGSGIVQTIQGDAGSASAATINLLGRIEGGATLAFIGDGVDTIDLNTSDVDHNTVIGQDSGNPTFSGTNNTGYGFEVLNALTTGSSNTISGKSAGKDITTGNNNTIIGASSGDTINVGSGNTIVGSTSGGAITIGDNNLLMGFSAGANLVNGNRNLIIGPFDSGDSYTSSESDNILLGNIGSVSDVHTMRLGTSGSGNYQINRTFVGGINGVNVGNVASVVTINGDQLGSATITGTGGITVTPSANTIQISGSGTGPTYSTGSWTPYVVWVNQIVAPTIFSTYGRWTQIGNTVTVWGSFIMTDPGTVTSPTGQCTMAVYGLLLGPTPAPNPAGTYLLQARWAPGDAPVSPTAQTIYSVTCLLTGNQPFLVFSYSGQSASGSQFTNAKQQLSWNNMTDIYGAGQVNTFWISGSYSTQY